MYTKIVQNMEKNGRKYKFKNKSCSIWNKDSNTIIDNVNDYNLRILFTCNNNDNIIIIIICKAFV